MTVAEAIEELKKLRSDLPLNLVVDDAYGKRVYGIASFVSAHTVERHSDHVQTEDNVAAFISTIREF